MLPVAAAGLALGGKMMAQQEADEDARKRALQNLSEAYAAGQYGAPAPETGMDFGNLVGTAGMAGLDQAKANAAALKAGEDPDDLEGGLRAFTRGRMG